MFGSQDMLNHFRDELRSAGLRPDEIIPDGTLQRCPVEGKPQAKDGAYLLHLDEPVAGWWQNHRTGTEGTWTTGGNGRKPTEQQRQAWEAARQHREIEQAHAHAEAAERAKKMLAEAVQCTTHPYLQCKGVRPCPGLKVDRDDRLLVPVLGPDGKVQSLQAIAPDGKKRFMHGGRMAEGFFPIQGKDGPLLVCEGLATGLSLHEATGLTVVVAFAANNLEAAARIFRERHPEREIILAGDDDHATPDNPGASKAHTAALAVGGKLALPVFAQPGGGTDFNDLHQTEGLEVVRTQVEEAALPEPKQGLPPEGGPEQPNLSALPGPPAEWCFRVSEEGVFKRTEKENKQPGELTVEWRRFCSRVEVLAETRDAQGRSWGRLLAVHTREGQINEWAMPMELLAGEGTAYRAELLNLGLEISPGNIARNALHEYIATARPPERARCVDRIGWYGPAFVLPDATYGNTRGERVLYQAATASEHPFRIAGTLEEWQEHLARLCVRNSRLAFTVSAAFAAPLLHLAGMESGGFHLRGGSSLGKTTALLVAGSVWGGGGLAGYCRNWRATSNGLEAAGPAHCDALLCLDELGQVDGREADSITYMLANGQGKSRARRNGSGRPPATWRVLFLSTGEQALADKIAEGGRKIKAGQEVRLVDLPADAGTGLGLFEELHGFTSAQALADHLRGAVDSLYGTAARAYLQRITADLEGLGSKVNQVAQDFVAQHCPAESDGQVRRVATRFGLVAAAGELATATGLLPWPDEEAERAAAVCFQAWLGLRGGVGALEEQAALEAVRAFIQVHGQSRFQPWKWDGKGERVIHNRAGFIRATDQGREYLLFPQTFQREVCSGLHPTQVAKVLMARGLLVAGGDGRLTKVERLPDEGKSARLYVIKSAVLGDGEDD